VAQTIKMPSIYPKARLIRADAISVIVTWSLMVMIGGLGLALGAGVPGLEGAVVLALGMVFLSAGTHVILSFLHQCPSCDKHPTIQGMKPPHPASDGQSKAHGWSGVVMSVVSKRRFVCIHCGVEHDV
jgi:hypothetical protein